MTAIDDFQDELAGEIEAILAADFMPEITSTNYVPSIDDAAITFPNLDRRSIGCKLLESSILYVDIRGSTMLSHVHRPETMAKLYSAFVRAMVRCADYYGGKVRGVIGDRVMVIFDVNMSAIYAVETAVLMNSLVRMVLNKLFKKNTIECGVGIDFGKMLVTKTGVCRRGSESSSYKSFVWLGRPANVASKLADIANKDHHQTNIRIDEIHIINATMSGSSLANLLTGTQPRSELRPRSLADFLGSFVQVKDNLYAHVEPTFRSYMPRSETTTHRTAPILATQKLVRQYVQECKEARLLNRRRWRNEPEWVSTYTRPVFGCSDIDPALRRTMRRLFSAARGATS